MEISGLYIVTLSNQKPASVNAQDRRIADRCLEVNFENCKVGKAKNLHSRERNYWRTFGRTFVSFDTIVLTEYLSDAERSVLAALLPWRVCSPSGRRTEWLVGIEPQKAVTLALAALNMERIPFQAASLSLFSIPAPADGQSVCTDGGETRRF